VTSVTVTAITGFTSLSQVHARAVPAARFAPDTHIISDIRVRRPGRATQWQDSESVTDRHGLRVRPTRSPGAGAPVTELTHTYLSVLIRIEYTADSSHSRSTVTSVRDAAGNRPVGFH
jgi:hypothetical protein